MENRFSSDEAHVRDADLGNCSSSSGQPTMPCHTVFVMLGLLLLATAGFKTYQAYSEPMTTRRMVGTLILICFEVCFGVWLVGGARTKWTWRACVACFTMFACVSGYKALSGAASCGCFGTLEVNPWITLGIDVAAVLLLAWCRSGVAAPAGWTMWGAFPKVASIALTLSLLATAVSLAGHYRFVQSDGFETSAGQLVVLEPESWIGKRWPLITESGLETELVSGEWDVLLFRHDCHVCHDVMLELEQLLSGQPTQQKVALIGIESHASDSQVERLQKLGCLLGYLPQDREWFATTPLRLRLNDGVCVSAGVIDHWD